MNEDCFNRFKFRSDFIKTIRDFYHNNNFIEIETPVLGNSAS
jgi:lysyl-tRNA synthetase class II